MQVDSTDTSQQSMIGSLDFVVFSFTKEGSIVLFWGSLLWASFLVEETLVATPAISVDCCSLEHRLHQRGSSFDCKAGALQLDVRRCRR